MRPFLLPILLTLLLACGRGAPSDIALYPPTPRLPLPAPPPPWGQVNDFLYQLQDLNLAAVGQSKYDLVVMDLFTPEGRAYSGEEIAALKNSPGGPKLVLAYMSIGEAEDYRWYWQRGWRPGNPGWLAGENPSWPGNYKVRYWEKGWQRLLFGSPDSYLDRILAAGFHGVYLDIIDAYEYFAPQRPAAEQEMVELVLAIAAYARAQAPAFGIFPQNAQELGRYPEYLAAVTGIGREDVYYGYEGEGQPTPPQVTREMEAGLDHFVDAGKLVLVIDYTQRPDQVADAYRRARSRGFVPLATTRALDRLIVNPGFEPD